MALLCVVAVVADDLFLDFFLNLFFFSTSYSNGNIIASPLTGTSKELQTTIEQPYLFYINLSASQIQAVLQEEEPAMQLS